MRYRLLIVIALLVVAAAPSIAHSQVTPQVGFVVTNTLQTASLSDPGPDGLTKLAQVFARQGAQPTVLRLDGPISEDIQVVVLVGPQRRLSTANLAYLWDYLSRGGHLLVALDPNGYQGVNSERATDGLNQLLQLEFGTQIADNLLVQPWFVKIGLADLRTAQIAAQPDEFVPHPVLEPLVAYQLPVQIWGGRSVQVEPFGPGLAQANPLVYVESAYGETSRNLFADEAADPLELNIGSDAQGRLLIGGIGSNGLLDSRVAVLGDSEMLQNGFGLATLPGTETPRYPGNQTLVDRLVGWLLEQPASAWPALPSGVTWLQIDGDSADWDRSLPVFADVVTADEPNSYDMQRVIAIRNDAYSYLLIETAQPPPPTAEIWLVANNNGQNVSLKLSHDQIIYSAANGDEILVDGAVGFGTAIELRLPLRVVGLAPAFAELCLVNAQDNAERDCLDRSFTTRLVSDIDPHPLRNLDGPLAQVIATGQVNLRAGPGTDFEVVGSVDNTTPLIVIERNAAGDWLRVINSRYSGWITTSLVALNADLNDIAGPGTVSPVENDADTVQLFATNTPIPAVDCMIGVTDLVNRRAAPSTTAAVLGLLTPDEDQPADGQLPISGGLIWWRLTDGSWVRSDVVIEIGDCDLLPLVES